MSKEKKLPQINYRLCMACRVCVAACPFSCLEEAKIDVDKYAKAYPALVRAENCTGCGICVSACPVDVIQMIGA